MIGNEPYDPVSGRRPTCVRFEDLVRDSEGSQLISYTFENREVRFQLYHEGMGALITVAARTDTVYGRSVPTETRRARCRMRLIDLRERLFIKDGKFVPSTETEVAIEEARAHFNLAYGRRTTDVQWMLRLEGEYNLLCILLRDQADLHWTVE